MKKMKVNKIIPQNTSLLDSLKKNRSFQRHGWWEPLETLYQLLWVRCSMILWKNLHWSVAGFWCLCNADVQNTGRRTISGCFKRASETILLVGRHNTHYCRKIFCNFQQDFYLWTCVTWEMMKCRRYFSSVLLGFSLSLSHVHCIFTLCLENWGINSADYSILQNPVKGDVK